MQTFAFFFTVKVMKNDFFVYLCNRYVALALMVVPVVIQFIQ